MSAGRARFVRQLSIYFVATSVGALIQFVCVPVFARTLGPTAYGQLSLAIAAGSVLSSLMAVGGDVVLGRFWFDEPADGTRRELARRWISFVCCWSLVLALLAHACVVVAGPLIDPTLRALLPLAIYALVPAQLTMLLAQVLRNQARPWSFALTSVTRAVARAAGSLAGVLVFDAGAQGVLLGAVSGELAAAVLALVVVRFPVLGRFPLRALGPMLRFGAPIVPASFAFWAYSSVDRLVLAASQPASVVGAYSLAGTLAMPMLFAHAAVAQAWIPEISRRHAESVAGTRRLLPLGIELSLLGYGLLALILGMLARPLVDLIGGPGYAMAADVLPLLALATAFNCTSAFCASGATLAKKSALAPAITLAALAVELAALFLLVPAVGMYGAALACAAGYFAMTSGYLYYSQRVHPVRLPGVALGLELVALVAVTGGLATGAARGSAVLAAGLVAGMFGVRMLYLLRDGTWIAAR